MLKPQKVAEKLGLDDLGERKFVGTQNCPKCGTKLRVGRDASNYEQSYCPKCQKIHATVNIPHFPPSIRLERHTD